MKKTNFVMKLLAGASVVSLPLVSNAAISLTPITDAGADVALIGVAVFAVIVAIAAFKWIRRAL